MISSTLSFLLAFRLPPLPPRSLCPHLPFLFRAKRIQNQAVVNESPTERLVKELKAENVRLLQRLSRLGQEGRRATDETSKTHCYTRGEFSRWRFRDVNALCVCVTCSEELRQLLTHNELQIRAIQTLWEQHLQEALKDWEQQYANITQVHIYIRGQRRSHSHTSFGCFTNT